MSDVYVCVCVFIYVDEYLWATWMPCPWTQPQALLIAKTQQLCTFDATAKIEVNFLVEMSGASGAEILENKFLDLLPNALKPTPIQQVCSDARLLMQSKLFKFVSVSAQGGCKAGLELLDQLRSGRRATLPKNPSNFMERLISSLGFFYQGEKDGEVIYGSEALSATWALLKEKKNLSLNELAPLVTFGFLLSGSEQKELHNLTIKIVDGAATHSAPSTHESAPKAEKAKTDAEPGADFFS